MAASQSDDDNWSVASSDDEADDEPVFHKFTQLPPEIRQQIWRSAIPSPGINFFNIHAFPGDHHLANRSTSPSWLYLDLRRLAVEDDDDAVFRYDPSVWQVRQVLRGVCREARSVCAIPPDKVATVVLTRPKCGLYIRAGDGQLRGLAARDENHALSVWAEHRSRSRTGDDDALVGAERPAAPEDDDQAGQAHSGEETGSGPGAMVMAIVHEPVVRRKLELHKDDIFNLSIENCCFNLTYEDSGDLYDEGDNPFAPFEEYSLDDAEGWSFDPQLEPLVRDIPINQFCFTMARPGRIALSRATDLIWNMGCDIYERQYGLGRLPSSRVEAEVDNPLFNMKSMLDCRCIEVGSRRIEELTPAEVNVYWDRWGDCYVPLPWLWQDETELPTAPRRGPPADLSSRYRLTKVFPESNNIRERYVNSGVLRSPKRPGGTSARQASSGPPHSEGRVFGTNSPGDSSAPIEGSDALLGLSAP